MPSTESSAKDKLAVLQGLHIDDRAEFAKAIQDLSAYEDELMEAGCPLDAIDELITELEFYRGEQKPDLTSTLMQDLLESVQKPASRSSVDPLEVIPEKYKPKFPTGVAAVDHLTGGGGYGLTTEGGDAKVGKTMFAVGAAVSAARAGWRVIYVNAELDRNEAVLAVMRFCGGTIPNYVSEMMTLVTPDFTFQPMDAITRVQEAVQPGDDLILIVLDSINALVDLSSDGAGDKDFWAVNSLWRNFAVRTTRKTLGKIAFLVVSETNKDGGIKGRALEYKSDLVVRIQRDKERDEMVSIDVTHSRSTRAGELGRFRRNWLSGKFEACY